MKQDAWSNSEIQERFDLPVSRAWLAGEMQRLCKKLVAKNRAYVTAGTYRVFVIPDVSDEGDHTSLTWGYAVLFGAADNPCLQWRVVDTGSGCTVAGFCFEQIFAPAFYQLVEVARIAAGRHTAPASSAAGDDQVMTTGGGEQRGTNAGTAEKVREAHRRLKSGEGWKTVKRVCSHETYMRWCLRVTGEDPITK